MVVLGRIRRVRAPHLSQKIQFLRGVRSLEGYEQVFLLILGAALGAFSTWCVESYRDFQNRPRLSLGYRDDGPGHRLFTDLVDRRSADEARFQAMIVSLAVSNQSVRTARNCRGYLVAIEEYRDKSWYLTDYCDRLPLTWAYRTDEEGTRGIDIPKDIQQFLNIFYVCEPKLSNPGIHPLTIPRPQRVSSLRRFREPGKLRLIVQVAADDARTEFFALVIEWRGEWKNTWKNDCESLQITESSIDRSAPFFSDLT